MSSSYSRTEEKVASLSFLILDFGPGSTSRPTASMTADNLSGPMTDAFALGRIQRKHGQYSR